MGKEMKGKRRASRVKRLLDRLQYPRPRKVRKIVYRKVPKFRLGTIGKVESVVYDKNGRPMVLYTVQRRKPLDVTLKVSTMKKNPNKVVLASVFGWGERLQIFYYMNNPSTFYIAQHSDVISVPFDLWIWFRDVFNRMPPQIMWVKPKKRPKSF